MSSFEDNISALLGLIVSVDPTSLDFLPTEYIHESAAAFTIIGRLTVGDIDGAYRIYTHNGVAVRAVICNHLLFITNNGYLKYKKKLRRLS